MHWIYVNKCLIWDPWVQLDLRSSRASLPKCSVRCNSESHSVVSNSLQPHGLYSPWNSPGQNTGFCSLSLLQRIFPTQELNWGLLHCKQILYQLSYQGSPKWGMPVVSLIIFFYNYIVWKSLSHVWHSVVSDFLRPHGIYSHWNSAGQDSGVGSLFLL